VSDTRAFEAATGWRATVDLAEGVARLDRWLAASDLQLPVVPRRQPALAAAR
jgi:CDP-paratose 2-epimerase